MIKAPTRSVKAVYFRNDSSCMAEALNDFMKNTQLQAPSDRTGADTTVQAFTLNTADLLGDDLNYWAARAEGHEIVRLPTCCHVYEVGPDGSRVRALGFIGGNEPQWSPSTDPAHGQPIMERCGISSDRVPGRAAHVKWRALAPAVNKQGLSVMASGYGPTMLIASTRARIAQVFGDTVTEESAATVES